MTPLSACNFGPEVTANVSSLTACATALRGQLEADEVRFEADESETNTFYLLFCAALVFLMQAGFALLSAGSVRMRSVKNILLKSVMDACFGGLVWYLIGFGFAYDKSEDGNAFIGGSGHNFALSGADDTTGKKDYGHDAVFFFFQYCFAAAAATITSGAVAERCTLVGYCAYVFAIVGFVYPTVVHWVWDEHGFLSAFNKDAMLTGMVDFAGSGVVHMTGGICAFTGAFIIRPRKGRFGELPEHAFAGQSASLQVLGTFLLWFGWYGFNPGSTLALHNYARDAARAAVTTTLSAATAATTGILLKRFAPGSCGGSPGVWDLGHTCNSLLGGLVSITAGCTTVEIWASVVIGFIGAFFYHGASCLMRRLKIDDPLDAFAVHGACGLWGCLAVGFFCTCDYSYTESGTACGVFYGGDGLLLATQIVGTVFITLWVGALSAILFSGLMAGGLLRISKEVEDAGLDNSKHGGAAYPDIATAIEEATERITPKRITSATDAAGA
ncbi:putative ammonium transporter [Emiliania huxleyi CCMP1516]|uniref:Ammonium transporter n=2 Tax=Emiliania huxleyi TaxID=2903 RepID=A0A0D3KMD3_EMIH1|nr:putative ammonium transporter [Emiliania huxleyi CCMP1516]EOD36918.1 putative ammonium transporter [Emiliania huxleyi CCMP1516]|eukprot:XP_005789347.1 putative ammonium transporter [Emiliania huxleyi CCMP1516]